MMSVVSIRPRLSPGNQSLNARSLSQLDFSNPSPLSDGFENGPEFEVHYLSC